MRLREIGIGGDRALEEHSGARVTLAVLALRALVPRPEKQVIRCGVEMPLLREPAGLFGRQHGVEALGHRARQIRLEAGELARRQLIRLRPQGLLAGSANQPRCQADTAAEPGDGAFDHRIDRKIPRDLRQRLLRAFVSHGGAPRDHPQRADARELLDDRRGHAVREILLLLVP